MRVVITASGIQGYIFKISKSRASSRLRGRSALLGLVIDLCLLRLKRRFPGHVTEIRNAGSRLKVEIAGENAEVSSFLNDLRHELDAYAITPLDGQVWFAIAEAESDAQMHDEVADRKLRLGQAVLQGESGWNEGAFVFPRSADERAIEERSEMAMEEPDALLGLALAHVENTRIRFQKGKPKDKVVHILGHDVTISRGTNQSGLHVELVDESGNVLERAAKRVARHAPLHRGEDRLLDLKEIADEAKGAGFLGVLKADVDGLGSATMHQELSDKLEVLFAHELEDLMKKEAHEHCYIVYSGGDDLFALGPWDQLIRFIAAFEKLFQNRAAEWHGSRIVDRRLTLSAGFKLAHPGSPVRYLAEDVETALETAKKHRDPKKNGAPNEREDKPHKNCICIFERIMTWDELRRGIRMADDFKEGKLSSGFLHRMQHYAREFRRFEAGDMEGLRMVPLLHDNWRRNRSQVHKSLRPDLDSWITELTAPMRPRTPEMWRITDFAACFASYAARKKGEKQ